MTGFPHLFRWDRAAVAVPPDGQRLGGKYRVGAWKCTMCQALASFVVKYDYHGTECPGWVQPRRWARACPFRRGGHEHA